MRRLTGRSKWRNHSELLHQAKPIGFGPLFYNLAVYNPVEVHAGYGRFLPRRCNPLKHPFVFDANGLAVCYQVALREKEIRLRRRVDIEGGPVAHKQVFEPLAATDSSS